MSQAPEPLFGTILRHRNMPDGAEWLLQNDDGEWFVAYARSQPRPNGGGWMCDQGNDGRYHDPLQLNLRTLAYLPRGVMHRALRIADAPLNLATWKAPR